jgi:hypothetical protein
MYAVLTDHLRNAVANLTVGPSAVPYSRSAAALPVTMSAADTRLAGAAATATASSPSAHASSLEAAKSAAASRSSRSDISDEERPPCSEGVEDCSPASAAIPCSPFSFPPPQEQERRASLGAPPTAKSADEACHLALPSLEIGNASLFGDLQHNAVEYAHGFSRQPIAGSAYHVSPSQPATLLTHSVEGGETENFPSEPRRT